MSEIMNNLFGHTRNEVATSGERAMAATTTQEPWKAVHTNTIEAEETDADVPAEDTPSTADVADDTETAEEDAPTTDADQSGAEPDDDADDRADDTVDEDDENADENDVTAEDDGETGVDEPADPADPAEEYQAAPVVAAAGTEAHAAAGVRGTTTVSYGVVSKVVNMVAQKADGVHRLDEEDTSVTIDADIATIRIALAVEYGLGVKALAEQIRIDVIDAVEQYLGLDVAAVDVHVGDIHHPEDV